MSLSGLAWHLPKSLQTCYIWFFDHDFLLRAECSSVWHFPRWIFLLCSLVNISEGLSGTQGDQACKWWPYIIFQWCTFTFDSLCSMLRLHSVSLKDVMHILCYVQSLAFLCSKMKEEKKRGRGKILAHFPETSPSLRTFRYENLVDLNIFGY